MNNHPSSQSFMQRICGPAFVAIVACVTFSWAKTDVPLFLFSGQSNMVGLGANVSDLTADQKKTVDNIKIYQETEGAHKGKWLTLGPGFGGSTSTFGPELFFGKTLADSMPDLKIAFIKDAKSGTYLGKSTEWLPPSSGGPGTLYKNMMNHIDAALKAFNDAFDTSAYTPRWAGFIWHQGEFDAMDQSLANKYETNLTNLIKDIRTKADVENLPAIIPMIDAQSTWQYNTIVRTAEIAVAKKLENADTMDTKGLPTDKIHYKAAGMVTIGKVCALRWLNMHFNYSPIVPIVYHDSRSSVSQQQLHATSLAPAALFDLSGRRIGGVSSAFDFIHNPGTASTCVIIRTTDNKSGDQRHSRRTLNLVR